MRTPRIKICCIASLEEAHLAARHGADALGLVSAMPSGPGVIDEALIAAIAAEAPPGLDTFLLTSETELEPLLAQHARCRTTTLQLVDRVAPEVHAGLRRAAPKVALVQVVHVVDESSVTEALNAARGVDLLLLDSGNPALATKELGGTGRRHDWSLSARIVAESPVPVFLAGGLRPDNVGEALERVAPHGLDLCTGVRTNGALDEAKLRAFVAAART